MVIQRIQSVYLLLAALLAGIFCCSSFGVYQAEDALTSIYPKDFPVLLIVGAVVALVLFLTIFMYKDLRRQKTMTLISMLLICVLEAAGCFVLYASLDGGAIEWTGGCLLLLGSLLFAILAYRGMTKDQRRLHDSDRIR